MIIYSAVPYLVVAAPAVIVLLAVLLGGCTMTRTADEPLDRARFYSDPNGRAEQLTQELDRRAAREEMRRVVEEGQR